MDDYKAVDTCSCSSQFKHGHKIEFGCGCESSCSDEEMCFCFAQHICFYDTDGCLELEKVTEPIYECNDCCSCDNSCINRVVQKGPINEFNVVKCGAKGHGLICTKFIKRGTFVIEYIGKRIAENEAKIQLQVVKDQPDCYLYVLVEHFGDNEQSFYIDARDTGNVARFINHSCDPNLCMVPVRVNGQDPHFALFAFKDIPKGTELTFSYGLTNKEDSTTESLTKCVCGSNICTGFLPFTALCVV